MKKGRRIEEEILVLMHRVLLRTISAGTIEKMAGRSGIVAIVAGLTASNER